MKTSFRCLFLFLLIFCVVYLCDARGGGGRGGRGRGRGRSGSRGGVRAKSTIKSGVRGSSSYYGGVRTGTSGYKVWVDNNPCDWLGELFRGTKTSTTSNYGSKDFSKVMMGTATSHRNHIQMRGGHPFVIVAAAVPILWDEYQIQENKTSLQLRWQKLSLELSQRQSKPKPLSQQHHLWVCFWKRRWWFAKCELLKTVQFHHFFFPVDVPKRNSSQVGVFRMPRMGWLLRNVLLPRLPSILRIVRIIIRSSPESSNFRFFVVVFVLFFVWIARYAAKTEIVWDKDPPKPTPDTKPLRDKSPRPKGKSPVRPQNKKPQTQAPQEKTPHLGYHVRL